MSVEIESTEHARIGIIRYPDGRIAYGGKEREEAGRLMADAKMRLSKQERIAHLNAIHPAGLVEIRAPNGEVIRKSGAKPWLDSDWE